jgi:DNA-binding response OmpR family regulator
LGNSQRRDHAHRKYRILLVDDDADTANDLSRGLREKASFYVDAYSSPQAALASFKPNTYDLAILDIRMPGLNGFVLYRKLKELDPALTACFLSSFAIHQDEFKKVFPSMADKVKMVIKKPVSISELVGTISPILKSPSLANAVPGDHLMIVYETSEDLIEQSLEFLRIGIREGNEDVIFVTDAMSSDALRAKIAREWRVDTESLEKSGRLGLYSFQEWYMPNGKFDFHGSMATLTKRARQSIAHGRKGLRLVGDTDPFFELGMAEELMKYEGAVEAKLDLPLIAACAYSKGKVRNLQDKKIRLLHKHHKMVVGEAV